jgi:TRAP-type mannitol/chloroaromatic compound transport system substrate-binding protein
MCGPSGLASLRISDEMNKGLSGPDRRRVLGLAAGLAGGLAAPAVVRADSPLSWRLATAWPKDARGGAANARRLAEMIGSLPAGV